MDIWEANKISKAYTAHPCNRSGFLKCEDPVTCGDSSSSHRYDGTCDKDGCDLNPYRAGVHDFYGPGNQFKVDSTKPFSVVTQFHTNDGTSSGDLVEIRRLYIQNGKVIPHPETKIEKSSKQYDSLSDEMCKV